MATNKATPAPKTDARIRRDVTAGREERATADDPRAFSEDAFREQIRSEFIQEALPNIPDRDGYHYCWLSTTASHDPIHKRMRLGYQMATMQDVAGLDLDQFKVTQGEYAGGVSCNEMVLFKILKERYQLIMSEFHHHMPLESEQSIQKSATPDVADRTGKKLVNFDDEDEGMRTLGRSVKAPVFS